MKIVHSALSPIEKPVKQVTVSTWTQRQRYRDFEKACKDCAELIRETQKVSPDWRPTFKL